MGDVKTLFSSSLPAQQQAAVSRAVFLEKSGKPRRGEALFVWPGVFPPFSLKKKKKKKKTHGKPLESQSHLSSPNPNPNPNPNPLIGPKNSERFTDLRVILSQGPIMG